MKTNTVIYFINTYEELIKELQNVIMNSELRVKWSVLELRYTTTYMYIAKFHVFRVCNMNAAEEIVRIYHFLTCPLSKASTRTYYIAITKDVVE